MVFTSVRLLSDPGLRCVPHVLVYFPNYEQNTSNRNGVQVAYYLMETAVMSAVTSYLKAARKIRRNRQKLVGANDDR